MLGRPLHLRDEGVAVPPDLDQRLQVLPAARLRLVHDDQLLAPVPVPPLAVGLQVVGQTVSLRHVLREVEGQ